jgi:DNA (cytosine-5)-methyltransferase 1
LKGHEKGRTLTTILSILRGNSVEDIPNDIPMSDDAKNSLASKLNYAVDYRVLAASNFGVPQKRERIYLIGFDRDQFPNVDLDDVLNRLFLDLESRKSITRLGTILDDNNSVDPKFTISDKLLSGHERRRLEHKKKGNGFGFSLFNKESPYCNTISARYYKDGSEILIDQSDIGKNPRKLTPRECARIQGFPEAFKVDAVSNVQIYKQFGNSVSVPVIEEIAKLMTSTILKYR